MIKTFHTWSNGPVVINVLATGTYDDGEWDAYRGRDEKGRKWLVMKHTESGLSVPYGPDYGPMNWAKSIIWNLDELSPIAH